VSPSVIRACTLVGHDGGNTLQSQELCEGLRASPLNSMECEIFQGNQLSWLTEHEKEMIMERALCQESGWQLPG